MWSLIIFITETDTVSKTEEMLKFDKEVKI